MSHYKVQTNPALTQLDTQITYLVRILLLTLSQLTVHCISLQYLNTKIWQQNDHAPELLHVLYHKVHVIYVYIYIYIRIYIYILD